MTPEHEIAKLLALLDAMAEDESTEGTDLVDEISRELFNTFKQPQNVRSIFASLQDAFPDKMCIAGSYAYKSALGLKHYKGSDIDIFTNMSIASHSFKTILERVIFPHVGVVVTLPTPDYTAEYDMVDIKKIIRADFPNDEYPSMEFVFVSTDNLEEYLLNNQASTLTQCFLELNYSEKGFSEVWSKEFNTTVMHGKQVDLIRGAKRTDRHLGKLIDFCQTHDFSLKF